MRRLMERVTNLETVTNLQSFSEGRKAPAPPQGQLAVTTNPAVPGLFAVKVTNPEFLGANQNPIGAPIRHRIRISPYANFSKQVTTLPVSHQTYMPVTELGQGTFSFELTSTFDGQTFNNPVYARATA